MLYITVIFLFRLGSAYIDKVLVEHHNLSNKYNKMHDERASFSSFVNQIIEEYNESDCRKYYNVPCFNIDPHWRPLNSKCTYCDIPYNLIGNMETFEEDVQYILLKQNLTNIIPLSHSNIHGHKSGR